MRVPWHVWAWISGSEAAAEQPSLRITVSTCPALCLGSFTETPLFCSLPTAAKAVLAYGSGAILNACQPLADLL